MERRQLEERAATIWPISFAIGIVVLLVGLIVNPFVKAAPAFRRPRAGDPALGRRRLGRRRHSTQRRLTWLQQHRLNDKTRRRPRRA
jgi:hypothetical protein